MMKADEKLLMPFEWMEKANTASVMTFFHAVSIKGLDIRVNEHKTRLRSYQLFSRLLSLYPNVGFYIFSVELLWRAKRNGALSVRSFEDFSSVSSLVGRKNYFSSSLDSSQRGLLLVATTLYSKPSIV